jgi:hypothetical protein
MKNYLIGIILESFTIYVLGKKTNNEKNYQKDDRSNN